MRKRTARAVVLWLSMLVALSGARGGVAWAQAGTVDPQSLIGEWSGEWIQTAGKQHLASGPYSLTILRVQGDKVHG